MMLKPYYKTTNTLRVGGGKNVIRINCEESLKSKIQSLLSGENKDCVIDDKGKLEKIEIEVQINSEKGTGGIGFGIGGEVASIEDFGTNWLDEGLGDSFWENCDEFRQDLNLVREAQEENKTLSWEEAVFQVLGHFRISYLVNGIETDLNYCFDYEKRMLDNLSSIY